MSVWSSAAGLRPALPRRLPRMPVPGRSAALIAATVAVLAVAGFLWFRDSSFVAVRHVRVQGLTTQEAPTIRNALADAARDMTTLHVDAGRLRDAVRAYPVVKDVRVRTDFPHGLTIDVVEHAPVAAIVAQGRRVGVAADGTLLRDQRVESGTPAIRLPIVPGGSRLQSSSAEAALAALLAAPRPLRREAESASRTKRGLVVQLVDGPMILLGDQSRLALKWSVAAKVLSDPASQGAVYVDVRVPERPAAGRVPYAGTQPSGQTPGATPGQAPSTPQAPGQTAAATGTATPASATAPAATAASAPAAP